MRILQLIASMDPANGGPQEYATQLFHAMERLGGSADIATLDSPAAPWGAGLSVLRLGPGRWGTYGYSERLTRWIRSTARRYDAVLVHGLWQYHGLATWRALAGTATPYYVFPHGMLDPWFKRQYPLKHLKKRLYWPLAEYRVLRDAAAVLFTCEEEKQLARDTFRRYHVNEAVVGCGISAPTGNASELREKFLGAFPELRGKRVVLFLGRVHPKKGCGHLVEAFAAVAARDPALCLAMVGPGDSEYRAVLGRRAEKLGIAPRICWTGMLRNELKWGAFHAADVFVLPSHQENFGISVVEALACGIPVLVSNKVNIWREILADQAGSVADDTLSGTMELLRTWQDSTGTQRMQAALNARACFERRFHIDATTRNLLNTIRASRCKLQHTSAA